MAGSGGTQFFTVHLPLVLESTEQIKESGLQDVYKNLKQHLYLFQIHISLRKDLSYVQVKDVTFESGVIYLLFEFKDADSLDAFVACTEGTNNKLSQCISAFFDKQCYSWVADLSPGTKLTCKLSMSRQEYMKAKYDMSSADPGLRLSRQSSGEYKTEEKISSHNEVITEKSERTSVQEKVKQYDSSSNTELRPQPGSYPHREKDKEKSERNEKHDNQKHLHTSNNKQGAEDGSVKRPVLKKQFILYIPPASKGWKIDKVYMESEKYNILNKHLGTHCGNLYEARIDIPLELLEHQNFFSFHYVTVWKKTSLVGRYLSFSDSTEETSKIFFVEAALSCHRHLWEQPKPRPTPEEIAFGYLEHLKDIMFHCTSNQEFKERCIEIESLIKSSLPKEQAIEMLKLLTVAVKDQGYYQDSSVLYLVAINKLLTRPELIVHEQLIDTTDAMHLLRAIQSFSISSLPISCRRQIQNICYQFCMIALGNRLCILTYLSTCYPFYDEEYILSRVESYVTSNSALCWDSEDMFPFALNLCSKLYREAVEASSKTANTILEKLLRHLPLSVAFHVFACLNKESKHLSSRESDVQSVLYGSLSARMEQMLRKARKSNDLSSLLTCWRDIDRFKALAENFKSKYEDAIIQLLETHRGLLVSVKDIMSDFIDQYAFFKERSKQVQLIYAVCKSKSTDINELFVSLSNNSSMCKLYMQLERDQFKELCLLFVIGNSQLMSREYEFRYVCEHLNDIWCMEQMKHRHDFQEVWDNILEGELRKYRLRELLQNLKLIDNLSRANDHLGNVFLRYFKTSLHGNYEGFRPEEILSWLIGTWERPQVDLRISALVLNVLIDTYGHLQSDYSIFKQFLQLVEQCEFWRSVFSCEGKFVDIVKENANYWSVKQCIKDMTDLFKNNEVSYDFVVDIENNTQLCRATKNLLQLECKREVVEKYWSEALMKFKEEKEKLRRVEKVIKIVCSKLKSENIHEGFMNITRHLSNAEKQFTSGKMTLKECVKSNLIWRGIEQLPVFCKYLETVVPSTVFWNLSLKEVTEELMKIEHASENEDDPLLSVCLLFEEMSIQQNTENNTAKAIQFLSILAKSGVQIYKEMWSRILNDENFAMKDVLAMFGKKPIISEEVDIARRILYCDVSETVVKTLERVYSIDRIKTAVHAMVAVLKAFKIDLHSDAKFSSAVESFENLKKGAVEEYSLAKVRDALEVIFSSIKDLQEDTISILAQLGKSTSLIGFLQEIVDEDIRNLIDAVEDISEQQVQESTVSALIEVKRFVQPILIPSSKRTCQELIQIFETQTRSSRGNPSKLPTKIVDCMSHLHNLKSLYNSVANRGEQTKEMIRNIIQRGTFVFYLNKGNDFVDFEVNYKQNKKSSKETRQKSTLIDLRSRALLLMNTEKKEVGERHFQTEDLSKFVDYINLCLDIGESLFELYSSGHSEDTKTRTPVKPSELNDKKVSLKNTLKNWLNCLQKEREEHFLMNFVHGTQIHILYKYLEGDDKDIAAVHTLTKFIHPDMQAKRLRNFYQAEKQLFEDWNDNTMLHCLGSTLHGAHKSLSIFERPVTASKKVFTKITDSVKSNRLTVAQLEDGSINTVKTIAALYLNTTKRLPEPNQVLFCTRFTSKEEIDLLIRRCLGAESFYRIKPLFCIANVELLPNEMQFELVDALRHLGRDFKYLLALVCRGSRNHPFIDELNEYVTSVTPATDKTVHQIFHEHCSNVLTITSEEAGQGKSQLIHKIAHGTKKGVVTLHISGSIRKPALVEKLLSLNVRDQHLLHIDIGNVEDPTELDTFLFELIVLRFVSAGKLSFSLLTQDIKIEIANTHNNRLRNALQTAMLFSRKIVRWEGIDAFVVSKEIDSPTQIVCRYLEGLENNELDKLDYGVSKSDFTPMSRKRCRQLLQIYVGESFCNSYPVLHTFLNVLADQLKKLTLSSFFRISRLRDMVGSKSTLAVKSKLVQAMIQMSKEFAKKSLEACREVQMSTIKADFENRDKDKEPLKLNVNQVEGMIRWEESNHLVFVFHNQNIQTLTAFYRTLDRVESDVKFLFESQMKKKMADFSNMPQTNLQSILQRVARTNPFPLPEEKLLNLAKSYALTADNLLKMVLIMLRIKANVPVVVMGETGCGKTSLIRYLAQICEIKFDVMNIHAGVSSDEIVSKVHDSNELALMNLDEERWLFLDEINTSESIFMISDVICHHTCLGRELSPNLIVLGACNPYKLRTSKAISTAGLDSKVETDELSRLVYRVLPLPEMLLSYVWDFGSLSEADEKKYIFRMTEDVFPDDERLHDLLTNLLSVSQAFVREKESSAYSVSLRDVQRCKHLTKWFMEILPKKGPNKAREIYPCDIFFKAIILSLAHCYHCRFADKGLRKEYREVISRMFVTLEFDFVGEEKVDEFLLGVIREEQRDILDRMDLPPGTACNSALQENVFVILVCIFNRIPIFVVGKPGCSKSLAMQLIRSNLRGKDSTDNFFKFLPQLYCVSFQGSESSTSDGIFKVFEKAEKYQISNSREDVLSVVILDEIGLAEISRFNPLKVLHNLLEPDGKSQPNVAVVGISNWSLDASKMNRAIHLSRTDMDVEELFDTAISIGESFLDSEANKSESFFEDYNEDIAVSINDIKRELHGMAEAYFTYIKEMRFKNFHGLRDYYSLVKLVARKFAEEGRELNEEQKAEMIVWGLERNFGGLPAEKHTLHDVFGRHVSIPTSSRHTVIDLITQNVQDTIARHLMLITTGESVLGIIEQKMQEIGYNRIEVIYGSQFEEDLTDDYNYRILSRIILCMEEGVILILKDLESIYGSLYDMLNQNYTMIGKKKNCRVALGPYSNPICHVADTFRCIVLIDEGKLDLSDPPFLNRFEKQYLRFFDIIEDSQMRLINEIESWIEELLPSNSKEHSKHDIFPVYTEDMVASLVLKHDCSRSTSTKFSFDTGFPETDLFRECQKHLLWFMKPEMIVQIKSVASAFEKKKSQSIATEYFSLPIHGGMCELISFHLEKDILGVGNLSVIFTTSNIHTKLSLRKSQIQVEKLGAFKSEKQLSSKIQLFWDSDESNILIVQCNTKEDGKHLMLTKLVIERCRRDYQRKELTQQKHVYLVIHLDRLGESPSCVTQLNFLSDWDLIMLDSINCPQVKLPELCSMTLLEAIQQKRPLHDCLKEELFWAFTRIKYETQSRDITSLTNIIAKMENSPEFLEMLDNEMWTWIWKNKSGEQDKNWQSTVACNVTLLNTSTSFVHALETFILSVIKIPLAKYIYKMELSGILDSFFCAETRYMLNGSEIDNMVEKRKVFISLLNYKDVFSIDDIPNETGPECYTCHTNDLSLEMPFSMFIFENIEETKDEFLETVRLYRIQCLLDEDEELPTEVYEEVLCQQENHILQKMPDMKRFLYRMWGEDYFDDFCNICSNSVCPSMPKLLRTRYTKLIMTQHTPVDYDDPFRFVIRLHTTMWVHFSMYRAEMMLIDACLKVVPDIEPDIDNALSHVSKLNNDKVEKTTHDIPIDEIDEFDDSVKLQEISNQRKYVGTESIIQAPENVKLEIIYTKEYQDSSEQLERLETVTFHADETENSETNVLQKSNSMHEMEGIREDDNDDKLQVSLSEDKAKERENEEDFENPCFEMSLPYDTSDFPKGCHSDTFNSRFEESLSSQDCLVQFLCKKMIPTTITIEYHGGIQQWYSKVSCTLTLAYQVTRSPKLLFSLRVCTELAAKFIIPFSLEDVLLKNLGNMLNDDFELDSMEVFETIGVIFNTALNCKILDERLVSQACAKMLSSYLIMCISSDPETCALDFLFTMITNDSISADDIHFLKAPLCLSFSLIDRHMFLNLLQKEHCYESDSESESVCEEREGCDLFDKLDKTLTSLNDPNSSQGKFIVLVVDLFQELYAECFIQEESDENEDTTFPCRKKSNELDMIFLASHKVLREKVNGIQNVAAIAFVKAYIDDFAYHYQEEEIDKCKDILDVVLADECDETLSERIRLYFLKGLVREKTFCYVQRFLQTNQGKFKFLQQVDWTDGYFDKCLEKSPLCLFTNEEMHKSALFKLNLDFKTYKEAVENTVAQAATGITSMIKLLSVLVEEFYLSRFTSALDDTKRTKASMILNEVIGQNIEGKVIHFIKCLTGEQNFSFDVFNLTEESNEKDFYKVSFCTTLYALAMCHSYFTERNDASVLIQCLCFPADFKNSIFPGFPNDDDINVSKQCTERDDVTFASCPCGNILAFFKDTKCDKCLICNSNLKTEKIAKEEADHKELKRGLLLSDVTFNQLSGVRGLQPASYHILQLLTKACLLGAVAVSPMELSNILHLFDVPENEICNTLWETIIYHWEKLCELLGVEDNVLYVLLQAVVSNTLDLLFKVEAPSSSKALLSWEERFEYVISSVVDNRFQYVKETIIKHDSLHEYTNPPVEQHFWEVDNEKEVLYRVISVPCKMNFLSQLYPHHDKFPVLSLILNNEHKMELPQHILNIVNWHKATIANSNYMLKKSECLKMTVQDFIYHKHERGNKQANDVWDRFESFRESWEYLMEHINVKDIVSKMKRIHSESKMSECLLIDTSSVIYMVLRTLVEIQNNLIIEILALTKDSAALQFLLRDINVAVVRSVPLISIKKEELFACNIDWMGLLRQESQCDLRYGHGRYIRYDFSSIEQSTAVETLSRKAYIQMSESLPKIMFIDELHKNYSSLIRQLKVNIPQDPLPSEIVNGIKSRKEEDPRMATELLTHLGIVMSLLKKTNGDPERPLVEYVDGWKSLLTHSFPKKLLPNPETSVKLCHVVALSELLEELCAESVKNALSDDFRCKLDGPLVEHILKTVKDDPLAIIFLKAIKRFTFRCLSSQTATANQSLREYLSDDTFWPDGCLKEGCLVVADKQLNLLEVVPDGLMVRHTFACLTIIEKELEKRRQESMKLTTFASSFKTKVKSSQNEKMAEKKRKASKYRKF